MPEPIQPFRWDLARREQLGGLLAGRQGRFPFPDQLVECAAKIMARSSDGDLFFVGRSADSIHDLLRGALANTGRRERLHLLPYSHRFEDPLTDAVVCQLRVNLTALGVSPYALARRVRPVVFTDLVYVGWTFANLYHALRDWIDDEHESWDVIRTKIRFLGITQHSKTSPNTWRWWQHAPWTADLPRRAVTNVSLDRYVWSYLGDHQDKLTRSFRPPRWADPSVTVPRHDDKVLNALSEADALAEHGRSPRTRDALARVMAAEPTFREPWLRTLVLELRR